MTVTAKDLLELVSQALADYLESQRHEVSSIENAASKAQISTSTNLKASVTSTEKNVFQFTLTTTEDGRPTTISTFVEFAPDPSLSFPLLYEDFNDPPVAQVWDTIDSKLRRFFGTYEGKKNQETQQAYGKNSNELAEAAVTAPATNKSDPHVPAFSPPSTAPPKPAPGNLAAPKFDDELQLQSSSGNVLPSQPESSLGVSDLYPGGIKDPLLKPSLDPLRPNPAIGGGMHPTAADPLFNRFGQGSHGRPGIRSDNPVLGPDEDIELIGSGLPGTMGLPGQSHELRPRNSPGPPGFGPGSGYGSGPGFGGFI